MTGLDWMSKVRGPESVIIWSGAGLSADSPTDGPLGNSLTYRALNHLFVDVQADVIEKWFTRAAMPTPTPRLETVLSVARNFLGDEAIDWLLSDLHDAAQHPNDLHRFAAEHLAAGGAHITANVDRCIENVDDQPKRSLIHFHGRLTETGSTSGLGLVLENIENGFPEVMQAELLRTLTLPTAAVLLVVGYSGSDFFDVMPFLSGLPAGSLDGLEVVWCQYGLGISLESVEIISLDQNAQSMLTSLESRGAAISAVKGPTRLVLATLADKWGLTSIPSDSGRSVRPPWSPTAPLTCLTQHRRETASVDLYARLGLPNLVLQYSLAHPHIDLDRVAAEIGEAHRTAGEPHAFLFWATRAWPGKDSRSWVMREERRVQALRGAGRQGQAARHAMHVARRAEELAAQLDPVTHLAALDVATGTLFDRYRSVLGKIRPYRAQARYLLRQLDTLAPVVGPDLKLKSGRVRRDLDIMLGGSRTSDLDRSAATIHQQASSVIRSLNYRQGLLRSSASRSPDAYRSIEQLHATWMAMGQYHEAARLTASPLALRALGVVAILTTLRKIAASARWPPFATLRAIAQSIFAHFSRNSHG